MVLLVSGKKYYGSKKNTKKIILYLIYPLQDNFCKPLSIFNYELQESKDGNLQLHVFPFNLQIATTELLNHIETKPV